MLFCFSATGNTLHAARGIAHEGERLVSMEDALRAGELSWHVDDGRLGILSPTYCWTLPSLVREFLERAEFSFASGSESAAGSAADKPYVFLIATFGITPGGMVAHADAILREKGLPLDAAFGVSMPDTWTPIFNLSDKEKVAAHNARADKRIKDVRAMLDEHVCGRHLQFNMPGFTSSIGKAIYDNSMRLTSKFTVEDTCIGCGLCAKKCPVDTIEIRDGRPVWVQDRCAMCLRCLHRCPKFAIQRSSSTKRHGQYTHE
mgnify:FL=1